jgi:hypothetical protein
VAGSPLAPCFNGRTRAFKRSVSILMALTFERLQATTVLHERQKAAGQGGREIHVLPAIVARHSTALSTLSRALSSTLGRAKASGTAMSVVPALMYTSVSK